jgi:hypothetical protein
MRVDKRLLKLPKPLLSIVYEYAKEMRIVRKQVFNHHVIWWMPGENPRSAFNEYMVIIDGDPFVIATDGTCNLGRILITNYSGCLCCERKEYAFGMCKKCISRPNFVYHRLQNLGKLHPLYGVYCVAFVLFVVIFVYSSYI